MTDTITRTPLVMLPPSPSVALYAKVLKAAASLHPTMTMSDQGQTPDGGVVLYAPPPIPDTITVPWDADTHAALNDTAVKVLDDEHREDAEWGFVSAKTRQHPTLDGDAAVHLYVALTTADEVASRWSCRNQARPTVNDDLLPRYAAKLLPLLRGDTPNETNH